MIADQDSKTSSTENFNHKPQYNNSTVHICQMWSHCTIHSPLTRGADKSLAQPGRKEATLTEDFDFHILFIIIILVLFIYITWLASNVIFSPSNKKHREVVWAKDLSRPMYVYLNCLLRHISWKFFLSGNQVHNCYL